MTASTSINKADLQKMMAAGETHQTKGRHSPYRDRLLQRHEEICKEARRLMRAKNCDYGADDDPFRNFRSFGAYGILVRLSDKLARIRGYVERGKFEVQDEQINDTCLDAINYVILLQAILEFGDECNGGKTVI
jgi:hypothetical protein